MGIRVSSLYFKTYGMNMLPPTEDMWPLGLHLLETIEGRSPVTVSQSSPAASSPHCESYAQKFNPPFGFTFSLEIP